MGLTAALGSHSHWLKALSIPIGHRNLWFSRLLMNELFLLQNETGIIMRGNFARSWKIVMKHPCGQIMQWRNSKITHSLCIKLRKAKRQLNAVRNKSEIQSALDMEGKSLLKCLTFLVRRTWHNYCTAIANTATNQCILYMAGFSTAFCTKNHELNLLKHSLYFRGK